MLKLKDWVTDHCFWLLIGYHRFLGFLLAIIDAHGYVYIVNDMQRPRTNEKSGFHSTVSMKELPDVFDVHHIDVHGHIMYLQKLTQF